MELTTRTIAARKHIALVSHDHCKKSLLEWVMENRDLLSQHELYATAPQGTWCRTQQVLMFTVCSVAQWVEIKKWGR